MPSQIDGRFFVIGCILLAAAILLAFWGFQLGCLSVYQERILQWALPLASGFGAGAFAGALTLNSKSNRLIPGIIVTASGGFGVWLITVYVLLPIAGGPGCSDRRDREQRVMDLRGKITEQAGDWERASGKYPSMLDNVRRESKRLADEILRQPASEIDAKHQLTRLAYGSSGHLYAALAGDLLHSDLTEIVGNAKNAVTNAQACIELHSWLREHGQSPKDPHRIQWDEAYAWGLAENLGNYCLYVGATAMTLLVKYSNARISEVRTVFSNIDSEYLRRYRPTAEPIFQWACEAHGQSLGEKICAR